MRRSMLLLSILVLLINFQPAAAKDTGTGFTPGSHIRFEHFTVDDGLSQNAGLALLQDSRGYLWIGSQDGLNRYDGYSFKQYRSDPENPNSLVYTSIIDLFEDKDGYKIYKGDGFKITEDLKNESEIYRKRISDGLVLFAKYFEHLWD